MHPIHHFITQPVDFYNDEHEEGSFGTCAPTKKSFERLEKALNSMITEQKRSCKECGGTGIIDMEFYKRKCMKCCDADGN